MKFVIRFFCLMIVLLNVGCSPEKKDDTTSTNPQTDEWTNLLLEADAFIQPYGDWEFNHELKLPVDNRGKKQTNIWTREDFQDFVLNIEFRVDRGTNSGIFLRSTDINDPVQSAIEVQIRDDFGKSGIDKSFCGAVYDCVAPASNAVKPAGEWNNMTIACRGPEIEVTLNKEKVVVMDLDEWTEPGMNPDGTKNKFNTAYKNMARKGKIGFQDHGGMVSYRNIMIKRL